MNPIAKRLEFYGALITGHGEISPPEHDYYVYRQTVNGLESYLGDLHHKRILDVGCGWDATQTVLLTAAGFDTTGVDLKYLGFNVSTFKRYQNSLRINGPALTLMLAYNNLGRKRHYMNLQRKSGLPVLDVVRSGKVDVRCMDTTQTAFPSNYFDAIISNAVLEHVRDLDALLLELARITKPGGVQMHGIHLFPSPSGGHHPLWRQESFDHWDHLIGKKHFVPADLNGYRLSDYYALFDARYNIISTQLINETKCDKWLTPSIREALASYTEEDLTTRGVKFIVRKRR